jgi:hypothetical protein
MRAGLFAWKWLLPVNVVLGGYFLIAQAMIPTVPTGAEEGLTIFAGPYPTREECEAKERSSYIPITTRCVWVHGQRWP